jgi:methionine-S-sulfoxide reductase
MAIETITLGGGCFWCIEGAFRTVKGVRSVISGYAGGQLENPTYKAVCTGETGHAEVVQIEFDTQLVDLELLFKVFFTVHDPTTLNRQGADVGTQYRSVIFFHDEDQQVLANHFIRELDQAGYWADPIVTEVSLLEAFYEAEDYHQNYYAQHSSERYCQLVIRPKLEKLQMHYEALLNES